MNDVEPLSRVLPIKDESAEHPVPTEWRQAFRDIVAAFMAGDLGLDAGVDGVEPIPEDITAHIRAYLEDYGATLTNLPEETWTSSVCLWYGDHWETLVDLWTVEEGRSDLVLHAEVTEVPSGFNIRVRLVYVP